VYGGELPGKGNKTREKKVKRGEIEEATNDRGGSWNTLAWGKGFSSVVRKGQENNEGERGGKRFYGQAERARVSGLDR